MSTDIFATASSVIKAGYRSDQERDPKSGKWVKEAGAALDSLRARHKRGMSDKDKASLRRDVKSHISELNRQLRGAQALHNKLRPKPKPIPKKPAQWSTAMGARYESGRSSMDNVMDATRRSKLPPS